MSQSSLLEPLLFSIHIHGSPIACDLAHADVAILTSTLKVFSQHGDLNNNINEEQNKICNWLNVNKLALHFDKAKVMIFHMICHKGK